MLEPVYGPGPEPQSCVLEQWRRLARMLSLEDAVRLRRLARCEPEQSWLPGEPVGAAWRQALFALVRCSRGASWPDE